LAKLAWPVTFAASLESGPGSDLFLGLQTKLDHIQASLTALRRQVQQTGIPVTQLNGEVP